MPLYTVITALCLAQSATLLITGFFTCFVRGGALKGGGTYGTRASQSIKGGGTYG